MTRWQETYMKAKYHYSIAQRLHENYQTYKEKRLLVGMIKELAKTTKNIIQAYLHYHNKKKHKEFNNIAQKYLNEDTIINLQKILEVEKAQQQSPIQFAKEETIILLIQGKYRFLKTSRLTEFLKSLKETINALPTKK